jgi:protein-S-isoprenylcysteine O-methyltransferase Ste14
MDATTQGKTTRKGFWAVTLFYLLIAFEFFYMASPFAVYFYSVYRPGMDFLGGYPQLAWLAAFFLPHIVAETDSILINLHNAVGMVLFAGGIAAFCIGAGQVYYRKLAKKGAAVGGVYRYIRHPQYLSLAISGLGLLLLWPRYIVLLTYVTILLAYYGLARLEERECLAKFGKPYEDYMRRTGMFLPFRMPSIARRGRLSASSSVQAALLVGFYVLMLTAALGAARGVEYLSIRSLYGYYTENSATISLVKMDNVDLKKLVEAAKRDGRVGDILTAADGDSSVRYLNYVLPADRYVSEIPMNPVEAEEGDHFLLAGYRGRLYRIVITRADCAGGEIVNGRDIVLHATDTVPLVEAVVDTRDGRVIGVEDPAGIDRYENMPMPVF